ncbi:MAG: hypothetical protein AABW49_03080 [Nanoarchaeota archaeon]
MKVSIKQYPQDIFENNLREDILIKEVIENHIIITGIEPFINKVITWTK